MLRFKMLADCLVFVHGKTRPVQKGDEFDVGLYADDTTYSWISSLLASKVTEIVGWEDSDSLPEPEERLLKLFPPVNMSELKKKKVEGVIMQESSMNIQKEPFDRLDFVE
jgi:hypothetical protein